MPVDMKTLIPTHLNKRQLAGLCVLAFVLAGALVGYAPQLSSLAPSPAGYEVVNGPAGVVNGTVAPEAKQQVTLFSTTAVSETMPTGTYSTSFGGRMIELEAYLTIQVEDAQRASDQAAQIASSLNGYIAASSFDNSEPSANIVLCVPESNFSSAMRSLSSLGLVKAQSISSNDVTEEYVNLQAQLASYTTEEATLLRILNSSTTVSDALDTENAIQNTQAQINDIEGQLLVTQRLVAFATINIQFTQPLKNPALDLGDALNSALLALYTVTTGMVILGGSLIPVATVGGLIYLPYRHLSRRKPKPIEAK
jgi:hypothetical protein